MSSGVVSYANALLSRSGSDKNICVRVANVPVQASMRPQSEERAMSKEVMPGIISTSGLHAN